MQNDAYRQHVSNVRISAGMDFEHRHLYQSPVRLDGRLWHQLLPEDLGTPLATIDITVEARIVPKAHCTQTSRCDPKGQST